MSLKVGREGALATEARTAKKRDYPAEMDLTSRNTEH